MVQMTIRGGNQSAVNAAKPWGRETTFCVTRDLAIKEVDLDANEMLSLQAHVLKGEVYVVLQGSGVLELGRQAEVVHVLSARDVVYLPPRVAHRLIAGPEGLVIWEVSTPEVTDIMRLSDRYGRQANADLDIERYWALLFGPAMDARPWPPVTSAAPEARRPVPAS